MPTPSAGLDLVSPIDNMEPNFALDLINVIPGAGGPKLRLGYQEYTTSGASITGALGMLQPLILADGSTQLIAANATKLFSVSTAGVATDISKVGGYTNADWQTTVYNNRIYLCNGTDAAQVYSGVPATPAANLTFTGVTLSNLIGVTSYKERLYFIEKSTSRMWYGGLQVTGTGGSPALTSFDFSYVFKRGGYLVAIGSYSSTSSYSSQEYFWACSSEGEVVFYSGTYAGDVTTWGLVAQYYVGAPLGRRAFIRVNNDTWILTAQGIVPLSALFKYDSETVTLLISGKVNPLISQYAKTTSFSPRWTGFFWPQGRRVYIQVPISGTEVFYLVFCTDTQAWTKVKLADSTHGIVSCAFNGLPFFGSGAGKIYQGETGFADAVVSGAGSSIAFTIQTPFSFYGSRGNYKTWKDIRPILKSLRELTIGMSILTDFKSTGYVSTTTFSPVSGSYTPWGSPWGSPWSGSVEYIFDRFAAQGQGHCASIKMQGSARNTSCDFLAFEVRYEVGGQV